MIWLPEIFGRRVHIVISDETANIDAVTFHSLLFLSQVSHPYTRRVSHVVTTGWGADT